MLLSATPHSPRPMSGDATMGLAATSLDKSGTFVRVTWDAVDGADHYTIIRNAGDGSGDVTLYDGDASVTQVIDNTVPADDPEVDYYSYAFSGDTEIAGQSTIAVWPGQAVFDSSNFTSSGEPVALAPDGTDALPVAYTSGTGILINPAPVIGGTTYFLPGANEIVNDFVPAAQSKVASILVLDAEWVGAYDVAGSVYGVPLIDSSSEDVTPAIWDQVSRLKLLLHFAHQATGNSIPVGIYGLSGFMADQFIDPMDTSTIGEFETRTNWVLSGHDGNAGLLSGSGTCTEAYFTDSSTPQYFACKADLTIYENAGHTLSSSAPIDYDDGQVDFLAPSFYHIQLPNGEVLTANAWTAGIPGLGGYNTVLQSCTGYAVPVYSFLSPGYDPEASAPGQFIPLAGAMWQMELDLVCEAGDGAIIWGGGGSIWDPTQDWWTRTQAMFDGSATGAFPSTPSNNVSFTTVSSNRTAQLTWTQPAVSGAPVAGFLIERSQDSGTSWQFVGVQPAHDDGGSGFVYQWTDDKIFDQVSGSGNQYLYRVSAYNQFGASSSREQTDSAGHVHRLATGINDAYDFDPTSTASRSSDLYLTGSNDAYAKYTGVVFPSNVNQVTLWTENSLFGSPLSPGSYDIQFWIGAAPATPGSIEIAVVHSASTAHTWQIISGSLIEGVTVSAGAHDLYLRFENEDSISPQVGFYRFSRAVPTNLTAAVGVSGINLSWNAVSGASAYHVYRRQGANFAIGDDGWLLDSKGNPDLTGTTYTDSDTLGSGQLYYYMVTAVFPDGFESDQSKTAAVIEGTDGADNVLIADATDVTTSSGNPYAGIYADWLPAGSRYFLQTDRVGSILLAGGGGEDTITFAGSVSAVTFDAGGTGDHLTISAGMVTLPKTTSFSDVTITGGDLELAPHGTNSTPNVLVTSALSISGTGQLDVTDNGVIVNYGTNSGVLSTIRSKLINGRNTGGTWDGADGINSTTAHNNAITDAVGYADNSAVPSGSYTSFMGQTVGSHSILIRYVPMGDVNLDGAYDDTSDWSVIAANVGAGSSTGQWYLGDLNYSGACTDADATLVGKVTGLAIAVDADHNTFTVNWDAGPAFVDHFNVYRGTSSSFVPDPTTGTGNLVGTVSSNSEAGSYAFSDSSSFARGVTYYYKVTWVDANGNESHPTDAIAVAPPSAPAITNAAWNNDVIAVEVDWTSGASYFNIYRDGTCIYQMIGGGTYYDFDSLSPGTYHYTVTAVGDNGLESSFSNVAAVTLS